MRIDVDCSCFLETSTHLQETKLKIVVLLSKLGIAISPNVLSLSTLDNNTTTFSFVSPRYRCCIAIIFVSLNNKF
jgi:hypothetical protein